MSKKLTATIIMALFMFISTPLNALAYDYENPPHDGDISIEHLNINKNAKVNLVKVTSFSNIVQKENIMEVAFAQNFNSKYYREGDYVQFDFRMNVETQEGTCIIPVNSSLIAKIIKIEKPKWFSKNAKVCIEFTHLVLSDGRKIPIVAKLFGKKEYLQMSGKATAAKIAAYTLSIGGVGTGLGAAIGVASGNVITGLIIGGSIGGGVGLISGIVSPGLHYRAKKGQLLPIVLEENLKLPKLR